MSLIFSDSQPTGGTHYGQVGGKWSPTQGYDEQAARDAMRGVRYKKKDEEPVDDEPKGTGVRNRSGQAIGVTIDGIFYESINAASRAANITVSALYKALNKGRAQCKGHTVAYATKEHVVASVRRL